MVFAFPMSISRHVSYWGKILYGLVNEKSNHLMERSFAPGLIWKRLCGGEYTLV